MVQVAFERAIVCEHVANGRGKEQTEKIIYNVLI